MSTALRPEVGEDRPNRVIGAEVVDVEEPLHLVRTYCVNGAVHAETSVADHDIEAAEAAQGGLDQRVHVARAGHISGYWDGLAAVAGDLARQFLEALEPAGADDDGRAPRGEVTGCGLTDAGRSTGDGHHLLEVHEG